ncbi:MAG: Methyltransferase FkbM family [Anaerolineae bacterium 49_20]|nr:MAG: Methyltransferase FkbM family [Anaerolineae bacterium 49_20]
MSAWHKWSYYAWSVLEMAAGFRSWGLLLTAFLGKQRKMQGTLRFWRQPTQLRVRGAMDIWSVKETFLDQFYTRYGTSIEPDWVIVDIGAAIGEFTVYAVQKAPAGEVFAYEPNPESFALLQENIMLNKLSNVEASCVGVWDQAGSMQLDLVNSEPLQGKTVFQNQEETSKAEIPVITFDQLVQDSVNTMIDLLKLDCEGAEYAILIGASAESLARVQRIVMEYHDLDVEHEHSSLVRFLESSGFRVQLHANPVHAEIGYLYAWRE